MKRRILIDLGPLRESRDFRLLFSAELVTVFGVQFTTVAIPYQVYRLTHSSFQVGAVSLVQLIPLILGALAGGVLADRAGRRRILVITSLLLSLASTLLAVNAADTNSLVIIYLVSAVSAGLGGVISTTCNAAVPALVKHEHIVAAYASTQAMFQLGAVVGPAICGLLIDAIHLPWLFALVAIIYVCAALAAVRMSATAPAVPSERPGSLLEGLSYIRVRQALLGAYVIDINAMVFGMPRALFPALALTVFHGGARTLGYLYTAPGAGALLGALTAGWLAKVRRQGWAVIIAVAVWGAGIVAFGLVHMLWLALILLAIAGWADVLSAVLRSTILQTSVPPEYRNRVASVQIAVVQGGPRLGDLESGAVASATSTGFSIVSGGLACIAGAALLAAALPGFRRHLRADRPPDSTPAGSAPEGTDAPLELDEDSQWR